MASELLCITHKNANDLQHAVADEVKVLWVVLDRRLSFDRHATSVARACNYHVQAIRHICRLLTSGPVNSAMGPSY